MSLRARLTVLMLGLVLVALVASDAAAYVAIESFLNQRAEQRRDEVAPSIAAAMIKVGQDPQRTKTQSFLDSQPGDLYILELGSDGKTIIERPARAGLVTLASPALPASITFASPADQSQTQLLTGEARLSTAATGGGFDYLVYAARGTSGQTAIVGVSMKDAADTLGQLLFIELLVTLLVLALVAGASLVLARLALRPLTAMERTASAIVASDLDRRVAPSDPRTEVGRLGLALNGMLDRIETAFHAREASEERLRRFVADASHELRTPLAAIRGYAELYRRGASNRPADRTRAMQGIEDASERMGNLVAQLLLLARLDDGQPLERKPVDVAAVATAAVEAAVAIDPGHQVRLETEPAVLVLGDQGRLRQAIDNLIANCRVHTPTGTTTTVRVTANDGWCQVDVADDGPGMTPEQAAHAFERFYRGDPSRSRDSGGSGLGLAIVAAIVQAHGGRTAIDSAPGTGTRVTIALPADPPGPMEPTA